MRAIVPSCADVIGELDTTMRAILEPGQTYYVLGGIPSSAIRHPKTEFDHDSEIMIAAPGASDLVMRENGTRRDIDILIDDVLEDEYARTIVEAVEEVTEKQLEVSVFGFDAHEPAVTGMQRLKRTAAEWVSSRTVDAEGAIRYELYPLSQIVPPESFRPYKLVFDRSGTRVNTFNPAGHVLAYGMRSITGIRFKDREKVGDMQARVFDDPVLKEEIMDGPFRAWLDFAVAIDNLGKNALSLTNPVLPEGVTRAELTAFRAKAKTLGWLESKESLIEFGQSGPGAKLLNIFVRAK